MRIFRFYTFFSLVLSLSFLFIWLITYFNDYSSPAFLNSIPYPLDYFIVGSYFFNGILYPILYLKQSKEAKK